MACTPTHCASYGTGTTTCTGHRGACPSNSPLAGLPDPLPENRLVYATEIEDLRTKIRTELGKWNAHVFYTTLLAANGPINQGDSINHITPSQLSTMISAIYGSGAFTKAAGDAVDNAHWQTLIDQYNAVRVNCICNSDCSCNAICSCHGDCGCNYSDERLKENIKFVETKNGVNVYTWNYIWDKAVRFVGVMAQELLNTKYAYAVSTNANGYYQVNYSTLPVQFRRI